MNVLATDTTGAEMTLYQNIERTILIIFFVVLWLFCGFAAGRIATEKGRQSASWYVCGFLFGIFAVLAALALKPTGNRPAGFACHCPKCGALNSEGNSFCQTCGAKFSSGNNTVWRCDSCGYENSKGARFCSNCGEKAPILSESDKTELKEDKAELKQVESHSANVSGAFQYQGGHILRLGKEEFDINAADRYDWVGASVYCYFGEKKIEILFGSIYQAQNFYNGVKK